ncbi:MAG TPA: ATP-binding protein [Bryobacteraceae bacterium]
MEILVWLLCVIVLALVIHHLRRTPTPDKSQVSASDRDLFETAPVAYFEIDREGRIRRANARAALLLGRDRVEILGQRWEQFAPSPEPEKFDEQLALKLSGQASLTPYHRRYRRPDGALIVIEVHEDLLRGSSGEALGLHLVCLDVTERNQNDERAFRLASDLQALFQAFPEFFLRLDRNGIVQDVKGGDKSDPFLAASRFLGHDLSQLLPPEALSDYKAAQDRIRRTKSPSVFEFTVAAPQPQVYEVRLMDLGWDCAAMVRNITSRKADQAQLAEYAQELERMKEELESALITARDATRLKSRFLATVSHEVRTPLNGVLGMTDLLLNTPLEPEQQEYATSIKNSATSLLSLIGEFLDLSRMDAGKLKLQSVAFSLKRVLDEIASNFALQAGAKGLEFRCEIAPNVPANVTGDPERLRQVLTNLLENAVKFTDAGRIGLSVAARNDSADRCELRFAVHDTGIGIASEFHSTIFERFSQVDTSSTRKYGGTGLGLAISKEIVERLGGEIGVDSAPERGSEFWFTAPFLKAGEVATTSGSGMPRASKPALPAVRPVVKLSIPASVPAVQRPAARPSGAPKREGLASLTAAALGESRHVLLAEDNPLNQRIAVGLLKKLGLSIDVVANGRQAVEAVKKKRYALILMDCQMPEMDGFEAAAMIRNRSASSPRTPICALTANAMEGDRERCLSAGMDDYIPKPISLDKLAEIVSRWIPGVANASAQTGLPAK